MGLSRAKQILKKNRYILGYRERPARRNRVNVDWWRSIAKGANLGDALSPIIVNWMLRKQGISPDTPVRGTKFITAVGSILDLGLNDSVVWGSGLLQSHYRDPYWRPLKRLDIRAVRGPRTADVLRARGYDCPDVFGDPAVLMPLIYQPKYSGKRTGTLFASHFLDGSIFPEDAISMLTEDYEPVIDRMCSASLVVTSSLHGIILAESYGTPAVLVKGDREDFSLHKYRDWYESTGRPSFPVANNVDEALTIKPAPIPNVGMVQQTLMDAFPYDLWE